MAVVEKVLRENKCKQSFQLRTQKSHASAYPLLQYVDNKCFLYFCLKDWTLTACFISSGISLNMAGPWNKNEFLISVVEQTAGLKAIGMNILVCRQPPACNFQDPHEKLIILRFFHYLA